MFPEHGSLDAPRVPARRAPPLVTVDPDLVLAEVTRRLAANVRERRKAAALSQERLAETARVSTIYLGQLERGTAANPSLGVVASLAAALDCEPADLLAAVAERRVAANPRRASARVRAAAPKRS